jgi:hypothetical protein
MIMWKFLRSLFDRRDEMDEVRCQDHDRDEAAKRRPQLQGEHFPTKPWDVEVDVTLTSAGPPAVFDVQTCLPRDGDGNIVFRNNGRPGFSVKFRFYDNTTDGQGSGYAFPQGADQNDAIWSQLGENNCPQDPGAWDVFDKQSISIQQNGATLVVRNPNPKLQSGDGQGKFTYTLNVTQTGGKPYLPLDPGGVNMNGGSGLSRD